MDNVNDPKPTIEQMVDTALNPTGGQQGEQVAPTERQAEAPAITGEVTKTQEPVQQPETDKGFASHPAWQAREAKLKEAREELQRERANAERYAKLLDEQQKRQQPVVDKQAQALSIAERACKRKGWDISRLSAEQRDVINDQVELMMGVIEERELESRAELDKRLAPLEQARQRYEQEQVMTKAESRWAELAKEDKLEVGLVQTAINKFCQELDQRDPERTIKLSDEDLYYRATRPLLREKEQSQIRQEARDTVKQNARPLGRSPQAQVNDEPKKPQKARDFVEGQLDSMGIR
jgi:hypothetical protein